MIGRTDPGVSMFKGIAVSLASLMLLVASSAGASSFEFDPGFGRDGRTVTDDSSINDLVVDRRGRSIYAGSYAGAKYSAFYVARLKRNGRIDGSFGQEGLAGWSSNFHSHAEGVAVQPNGSVLAAGNVQHGDFGRNGPRLVRFRADGSWDRRFKARLGQDYHGAGFRDVISLARGQVMAAGFRTADSGGPPTATVMKFNRDGSRDRRFGHRGTVTFVNRGGDETTVATGLLRLASGKYLVTGFLADRAFLARIGHTGQLDRSFAGNGIRRFRSDGPPCYPAASCGSDPSVVVSNGSRIRWLVRDEKSGKKVGSPIIVGLTPDGLVDRGFGRKGLVRLNPPGLGRVTANRLLARNDGGLTVMGTSSRRSFAFGLRPDGSTDTSFGPRGRLKLLGRNYVIGAVGPSDQMVVAATGPKGLTRFQRLVPKD